MPGLGLRSGCRVGAAGSGRGRRRQVGGAGPGVPAGRVGGAGSRGARSGGAGSRGAGLGVPGPGVPGPGVPARGCRRGGLRAQAPEPGAALMGVIGSGLWRGRSGPANAKQNPLRAVKGRNGSLWPRLLLQSRQQVPPGEAAGAAGGPGCGTPGTPRRGGGGAGAGGGCRTGTPGLGPAPTARRAISPRTPLSPRAPGGLRV